MWMSIDMQDERYRGMYGAHRSLIERAVSRMDGHVEPDSVWSVGGWLRSLDLARVVAKALQPPLGDEPFAFMQKLTREQLSARLNEEVLEELTAHIWAGAQELQSQAASTGAALSSKFASEGEGADSEQQDHLGQ